ncbi:hypothetical protein [Comamonas sp.]|uniref:hypothetical protein n=1 Tax=Comamonas sp. TaxID=34028 RepID=UPI00289E43FB|nr:hypothetical protein [Comamonas sp.]
MKKIEDCARNARMHGLNMKLMHISALNQETRKTHAERHGVLFTPEQARLFWSNRENQRNCRCSVTLVMVDEAGRTIIPEITERARAAYEMYNKRYGFN